MWQSLARRPAHVTLPFEKAYKFALWLNREPNLFPKEITERLPVGTQQRVEIIKVLFRSAELIIFDEPTAVLTPQEVKELFNIMNALKRGGKAIIFITHKLHEVREVCDNINILRAGVVVGKADPKKVTNKDLANMMVGRPVNLSLDRKKNKTGKTCLLYTSPSPRDLSTSRMPSSA